MTCRNYSLYLIQFLNSKLEDFEEEENLSVKPNIFNPFTDEKQEFNQLDVQAIVALILLSIFKFSYGFDFVQGVAIVRYWVKNLRYCAVILDYFLRYF